MAAKLLAGVNAAVLPTVSDVQLSALAKGGALQQLQLAIYSPSIVPHC